MTRHTSQPLYHLHLGISVVGTELQENCDLANRFSPVNIAPEHVCWESRVLFLKWFVPSVCTFFRSTKASIVKCNDDDHSMGANNGHSDIFLPNHANALTLTKL